MRFEWRKLLDPDLWIFGIVSTIHPESRHRSYSLNFGRRSLYFQLRFD